MEAIIIAISLIIGSSLIIVSNDNFFIVCIGYITLAIVLTIKEFKEGSKHDIK